MLTELLPFQVILNKGEATLTELEELIQQQNISKIIIGLPYDKDGSDSDKTREVREFTRQLSIRISIPIELWDERYTTSDANSFLKEMGIDYKKSKKVIDKVAAAIILKDYLENQR